MRASAKLNPYISVPWISPPFAFRINDDALPELVENYSPAVPSVGHPKKEPFNPAKDIPMETHEEALDAIFPNGCPIGRADLQKALVDAYHSLGCQMNANKAVECIRFFKEIGMVISGGGLYPQPSRQPERGFAVLTPGFTLFGVPIG